MIDIALDPERSALAIIDMQVGYTDPDNVRGSWMRHQHPEIHRYFFGRIAEAEENLVRLLAHFRDRERPVIHVTFGWREPDRSDLRLAAHRGKPEWAGTESDLAPFQVGGSMHRIVEPLSPLSGEAVLNKTSHSAFTSTEIEAVLGAAGAQQIVIGGWATNACVGLTARDAADRGFETFLVEDACAAFTSASHEATVADFGWLYGAVATTLDLTGSALRP